MTYGQIFQKIIFGSRLPYKKLLKASGKNNWKKSGKQLEKTSFLEKLLF